MPAAVVRAKVRRNIALPSRANGLIALPAKARLCLSRDGTPGIVRERVRGAFRYRAADGTLIREEVVLTRIRALAIPPAWDGVWICPRSNGHIQATGRDARGRKQYRYHPAWTARRGEAKFSRMAGFGRALPRVRKKVEADLARPGLPREKVLAAVVKLLDRTHLRVGNAEYVRANRSFGLSTLLDRHVSFAGSKLRVTFRGKSGVTHDREVSDPVLAKVVRRCRDLPGQELFQYVGPDRRPHPIGSADVNGYLLRAACGDFTAKDFRTWAGTVRATAELAGLPLPASKTAAERAVVGVIRAVAAELGNTPAVCRTSYVHPAVIDAFRAGTLPAARACRGLSADEARVLRLLEV